MTMKPGLDQRRDQPHHLAAVSRKGWTFEAKALKQTRRRNEWAGTWRTERTGEPQRSVKVPWMREWMKRRRDRRRKASVDSVDNVRGRKMRICVAVESLRCA